MELNFNGVNYFLLDVITRALVIELGLGLVEYLVSKATSEDRSIYTTYLGTGI